MHRVSTRERFDSCTWKQLRQAILKQVKNGPKEIDILHWTIRTALELLCQGGLGHSFDTLEDETMNPLAENIKGLL